MESLLPLAGQVGTVLRARRQTIAVVESSAGGLLAASLLALPGASAYFLGGAVIYTRRARSGLLGIDDASMAGLRSSSEPYARLIAARVRERHRADWGLAETGAAGPSGNTYGDAPGHTCLAVCGEGVIVVRTLETGAADRLANMRAFARAALELMQEALEPGATAAGGSRPVRD